MQKVTMTPPSDMSSPSTSPRWSTRSARWLAALLVFLAAFPFTPGTVRAEPRDAESIPAELVPWIPWVTADLGAELCAPLGNQRVCQWPGVLRLELLRAGGSFEFLVEVDRAGPRTLPGGHGAWPQQVLVDGNRLPVLTHQDLPAVMLEPGQHRISGRLTWDDLPETLPVPRDTALIELSVLGQAIPAVQREDGKLWLKGLGASTDSSKEPEHVELSVFRQVRDGVPLVVETRLVFQVAGKARELTLKAPLLPGTLPLSVSADLALALESSGDLRVQLLPGRHEVTLLARHVESGAPLSNVARPLPWPTSEVWTFRPDAELRSVELSGLVGIDASRTELPEDWRKDGAYLASADSVLKLETTRKGQEQIPSNQLRFEREFWLDENARAFTVRDVLRGEMHQGFRLDLLSGQLGSVTVQGQPQVITLHQDQTGVEVRDGHLDLLAVSRVERTGTLRAVGWSEDAQSLNARLYLPPGWDVLFATGVDHTSRTLLARWDLFDVFYLLIVTFGVWRLVGLRGGLIAAAALLLSRGENGAPEYLWLPLVALAALLGLLPQGRLRSSLRVLFNFVGVLTIVALVAFSVQQVRRALYPHLDHGFADASDFSALETAVTQSAPNPSPSFAPEGDAVAGAAEESASGVDVPERADVLKKSLSLTQRSGDYLDKDSSKPRDAAAGYAQKQFHPDAVAQTGPGIPETSGSAVQLSWTGPVAKAHEFALYLVSPNLARLLTLLRLAALWGLAWLLFRLAKKHFSPAAGTPPTTSPPDGSSAEQRPRSSGQAGATLAVLSFLCITCVPHTAQADEPSDARLRELRSRLIQPPACLPHCISAAKMRIVLGDTLRIETEVHAGARGVYKLPGPAAELVGQQVFINHQQATALRLEEDGALYLRLEEGVFEVSLEATLPRDRVTLDVGTPPEHIELITKGWSVSGINEQGRAAFGTLTLQREATFRTPGADSAPASSPIAVPAFFSVERTIHLGVTPTVTTLIRRRSDASSPEVLRLPLMQGEQVTTPGVQVKSGVAEVTFPREESERELVSTLFVKGDKNTFDLQLVAPPANERTESWLVECGVIYRCNTEGLVATSSTKDGRAMQTFRPFPGETLTIHASTPAPADGTSVTVQKATYTVSPGKRTGLARLELAIQTSHSTVHTVTIPKTAQLESVRVGELEQAVKSQEGKVRVSLPPGISRVTIAFRESRGLRAWFSEGRAHAGAPGVNFRTIVELPDNRWLLAAGGPAQGPALLFWGYLLLIIAAAVLLPRLPYAPLALHHWLLLGLGLTQVPAGVAVFIAGWFFAMGWRGKLPAATARRRNLLQLALIAYTLAFLSCLAVAVYGGLVSSPDMEVQGAGSYHGHLAWYAARSSGPLPDVWVLSVNVWVWRGFMLLWALWLARSLLAWLRWGFHEMNQGGFWVAKKPSPPRLPRRAQRAAPSPASPPASALPPDQDPID